MGPDVLGSVLPLWYLAGHGDLTADHALNEKSAIRSCTCGKARCFVWFGRALALDNARRDGRQTLGRARTAGNESRLPDLFNA
jgi:hypothetical protein